MLKKKVYFKACFGEICAKLAVFNEILTLNLVIVTQFKKVGLEVRRSGSGLRELPPRDS
jgi:hypothetical protein